MGRVNPGKKVSVLLPDLRAGGAERVNIELAHEFAKAGHDVEFVLMRAYGELLQEAQSSFSVTELDVSRFRNLVFPLASYIRAERLDVLFVAMWPLTVIAPFARLISGRPCKVLVSEHGILSAQYRPRGRLHRFMLRLSMALGYRLADARVGVSKGVADDMSELSGLPREAFTVINNPVPPRPEPESRKISETETLWSAAPGGRVVTVGRMKAVKNYPLLLRAFALLERPDARLIFVGDGQDKQDLKQLADDLGVDDQVIFAGFQADPTAFYKTADLFVLSSDYEGFGNVIVEALACGTPVISTDCPSGPVEILDGGKYGTLVPVGDMEALANAMRSALDADHDKAILRRRAADFAPEVAARAYLDLLA